ncbi:MAG TPA: hypothetical protein VIK06_09590 [Candidatus Limnocylindrales bacterium]
MSLDDQIESALRRQPSDEPTYDEPVTALGAASGAVQPLRATTRARLRFRGRSWLAGLAALVALVAGIVAIGPRFQSSSTLVGAAPQQIQCRGWNDSNFSPDLLAGPGSAEKGTSEAAGALRQFVSSPYASGFPDHGWHLVEDAPNRLVFVARAQNGDAPDYVEVELNRGAPKGGQFTANGWSVGAYGSCTLRSVPPPGFVSALWGLDPAFPFTPGATELHILVDPETCTSGKAIAADRIQVGVAYVGALVMVTVAARPPDGAQSCQLTIGSSTPYVVKLDAPIGNRELQDGGSWPAETRASGGRVFVPATPTPTPSNWRMPTDCTGSIDATGFFKAASMSASYDVYCAVLPKGWSVATGDNPELAASAPLTVVYKGPAGETLTLEEGKFGEAAGAEVLRVGPEIGTGSFGDRTGTLGGSGGSYYVYTPPDGHAMWTASCTGMTPDDFRTLAAALIVVAK